MLKYGFLIQAIFLFGSALVLFVNTFGLLEDMGIMTLIPIGTTILYFAIANRFLSNVYFKEFIDIDEENDTLSVIKKTLFSEKRKNVMLSSVRAIKFVGRIKYTNHTMNNDIVDFTGLNTRERELQYLIDEGTIQIETDDELFRFGKNMSSWNADELYKDFLSVKN
jgi:hypothetical protein